MRHDVTFPLYVEVDEIYNLACPASPIHYQFDPVQTTKTSVHGAINMLGLAKRTRAKSCRPRPARSTATRASIRRPRTTGATSTRSGRGRATTRASAAPRRCASTTCASTTSDQGGADLQHLRPAHAPERRAGGLELHRPGAAGRADHHLRRRQPDPQLLLRRRPDRGVAADDGEPRRRHRADQPRQPRRVHHPASWPRRCSRSPGRRRGSSGGRCPRTTRCSASPTSPGRGRCSIGRRRSGSRTGWRGRSPISTACSRRATRRCRRGQAAG